MRKIGLDFCDKTIGIAVSDLMDITAQGVTTIERVGIRKDTTKVLGLVREYECDTIVVGLPLGLDGTDSIQTEKVREFRTMLENKLRSSGLAHVKLVWQDERFTTKLAENILIAGDVKRGDRKKVIDKQAAIIILQSYLDRVSNEQDTN